MKNIKYESFSAGRAGQGRIDLRTGETAFTHSDVVHGGSLPISVSHVYSTAAVKDPVGSVIYGKGFRLNLHQDLKKTNDDPNDTEYVLTDAACKEHRFEKLYYYLDTYGKRVYHKTVGGIEEKLVPGDITVGPDGKLTYEDGTGTEHEVFTETRTNTGLRLITTGPEGFRGAEEIETRHEELIRIETDIESLERNIDDLNVTIPEYDKLDDADYLDLKKKQKDLQNMSALIELTIKNQFYDVESAQQAHVNKNSDQLEKDLWNQKKVIRHLQDSLLAIQTQFNDMKDVYDADEEQKMKVRYATLKKRAEDDLDSAKNMLKQRRHILKQYREQMPVNYIADVNNITYGFNEIGDLVLIMDNYENYVSIVYENERIVKVIDAEEREMTFEYTGGKLSSVVDTMDRRTSFFYNGDKLEKIVYPNGDGSRFDYDGEMLHDIIPPAGMGLRLECDHGGRPIKISDITTVKSISARGVTYSNEEPPEDIMEIEYKASGNATCIRYVRTDLRTTYLFDPDGELITEYTQLDGIMKGIRTYDVGTKGSYFTMSQTEFDKNIMNNAILSLQGPNVSEMNGDIEITGNGSSSYAEWNIDINSLPEHATDLILSGFAAATNSDETADRRTTEYCGHFGQPEDIGAKFSLKALIRYGSRTKTFVAPFDHRINAEQFTAIPITLDEDADGEPVTPDEMKVIADYSNNHNKCRFSRPSLADGVWSYISTDDENRRKFQCGNRVITDKTVNGIKEGKFITYGETFFEYDKKGNLIEEETILRRNGVPRHYVTTHEYNKRSKRIRTTSLHSGTVNETVYDKKGNAVRSFTYHKDNPASKFVQESEISDNGQVIAETDERGENRTRFNYIGGTNMLSSIISPGGQELSIGTDPHSDHLKSISSSVNGEANETRYVHTKGLLTRLSSGHTDYDHSYDHWGRITEIRIADELHIQFEYGENSNGNDVVKATYANGEQYETTTDRYGKLLKIERIVSNVNEPYISYRYDAKDRLVSIADHFSGKIIKHVYNEDGTLNTVKDGNVLAMTDRNINGSPERMKFIVSEENGYVKEQTYTNVYDNDNEKLKEIILPNESKERIVYDDLGRITGIEHPVHNESIVYYQNGDNATNIVTSVQHTYVHNGIHNGNVRTRYNYDERGNIIEIRENNKLSLRYAYDGLNRLIREDNVRLGRTFTFDHDANGNILSKNEYKLTFNRYLREYPDDLVTGLGSPQGKELLYAYEEKGNRDRLSKFNDERCEYDELGNPFVYRNKDLKWSNLRDLVRYDNVTFSYDASGLRTRKINGDNETKFYWSGETLLAERRITAAYDLNLVEQGCGLGNGPACPSDCEGHDDHLTDCGPGCISECEGHAAYSSVTKTDITYIQGVNGLTGLVISRNGSSDRTYYYRRNIQGDITHIMDDSGEVKAEYVYDAFGNHEIIRNDDDIGSLNPFRYRGYYYDTETNLYYLRTRYYDPETGRFINADSIEILDISKEHINGLNLYAYAANNHVNVTDSTGYFWDYIFDAIFVLWSIADVIRNPFDWKNWAALGVDLVFAVIPFVPAGAGQLIKVGKNVDNVLDFAGSVKRIDNISDMRKVTMIGESMGRVEDAGKTVHISNNLYVAWKGYEKMKETHKTLARILSIAHNAVWIFGKLRKGHIVLDIGFDVSRKWPKKSPWYITERTITELWRTRNIWKILLNLSIKGLP